jgi:hypothetical protein
MLTAGLLLALQVAANTMPPAQGDPRHQLTVDLQVNADFLAEEDKNGDAALSLDEFVAALDRRVDAAIAANPAAQAKITPEYRAKMREGMMAPSFRGLDKNSDGRLTLDEVHAAAKTMNGTAK